MTSVRDPLGQVSTFEYDSQGDMTAIVDPLGNRTTLAYNQFGQPVSTTDPVGNTTQFEYDATGNLTATVDPLGNRTTREYDTVSRLIAQTDPRGATTQFAYDALSRITQVTDALGAGTQFSYDGNGNLLTVTDARGNTTSHGYDSMDRLATRTDPLGAIESFAYDGLGNLEQHVDRKGQVAAFSYDGLNRRIGASHADGTTTSLVYDAVGRLVQATDSVGGTILNEYDVLNRLIAQTTDLGTISYDYDALGRRTSMAAPGHAPVNYTYDAVSRLRTISQALLNPVTFDYDPLGRRTQLTLPNQVSTEYQYDAASRLTAPIYQNTFGALASLIYQYDAAGNRTSVGGSLARTLLPDPITSATYDSANRQLTFGGQSLSYDQNGNLTSDGVNTYTWDARNRLIGLDGPSLTASFAYDAFGRRVAKEVNGELTEYLYDGADIVEELTDQGSVPYLRSLNIDEPLVRNESEYYLADALGSIIGLTDSAGALATRYVYDPFGGTSAEGAPSVNPFQYTGREQDGLTGLYYYRARYYSPILQRFVSHDPLDITFSQLLRQDPRTSILGEAISSIVLLQPQVLNPFAYVVGNPILLRDPLGLINIIGGVGGSATAPTGAEGSVGIVINPGLFGCQADIGLFGSVGVSGGVNVSGDVFVGIVSGGIGNVSGTTVNVNVTGGPISLTVLIDPKTGKVIGVTVGVGPSAIPVGVSGSVSTTGAATLRGLLGPGGPGGRKC